MPEPSLLSGGEQQSNGGSPSSPPKGDSSPQGSSEPSGGDWKAGLPEEIRGEKIWEKHKDVNSALKSLVHLEKKLGSSINVPGEKATPEEVSAFYEKLGVPKTHGDYKVNEPKLPEGMTWDKDGVTKFTEVAHKLHLTPAQVQGVLDYYGEQIGSKFSSVVDAHKTGTEALKKEWGEAFDENIGQALSGLKAYDPTGDFKAALQESGADNDPRVLRFLQRIGAETGEKETVRGERSGSMTKEDAAKKVEEFQKAGNDHPLYNKKDPKHNDAVKEYGEALKLATS